MSVYISSAVSQIRALYDFLWDPDYLALSIANQLSAQADRLAAAHQQRDERVLFQIRSWLPDAAHKSTEELMNADFSKDTARLTIAREHGFNDWEAVEALQDQHHDARYEHAVEATINGQIDSLAGLLSETPELSGQVSAYGHQCTLLHYLGSNGIESW